MFETIQFVAMAAIWFLCPILIAIILLQGGGDVGSAFGGGGQLDSSLGVGAVRKISKITGWLVLLFMLCVVLVAIRRPGTTVEELRDGSDAAVGEGAVQGDPMPAVVEETVVAEDGGDTAAGEDEVGDNDEATVVVDETAEVADPDEEEEAADDSQPVLEPAAD